MDDLRFLSGRGPEPELLEHFQHRGVLWQHLRNQFPEASVARQNSQMLHEDRADTLTLVGIDHHESYLGKARPHNDIASTTDDRR
jgi:hypothetical protein